MARKARRVRVLRWREWAAPIASVSREVLTSQPISPDGVGEPEVARPPLLFVPGLGHGAWVFAEKWLEHAAARGYPAYAMSLRGHGDSGSAPRTSLRAYCQDVVQVAVRLPKQAVLIGHGVGAAVVARALSRYPARAGVLVSPVLGGPATAARALLRNPVGTLPALFGGALGLSRGQLFGAEVSAGVGREMAGRIKPPAAPLVTWSLLRSVRLEPPVGEPPMLVVGSADDAIVPRSALDSAAGAYGGAPLLFPGMGHDLMLEPRWAEPIDAILDWLDKAH